MLSTTALGMTTKLGATIANSLDKPAAKYGLGISDLTATAVLAVVMIICFFVIRQRPGRRSDAAPEQGFSPAG